MEIIALCLFILGLILIGYYLIGVIIDTVVKYKKFWFVYKNVDKVIYERSSDYHTCHVFLLFDEDGRPYLRISLSNDSFLIHDLETRDYFYYNGRLFGLNSILINKLMKQLPSNKWKDKYLWT